MLRHYDVDVQHIISLSPVIPFSHTKNPYYLTYTIASKEIQTKITCDTSLIFKVQLEYIYVLSPSFHHVQQARI